MEPLRARVVCRCTVAGTRLDLFDRVRISRLSRPPTGNTNTSRQRGMHERHPYAMIATLSFAKEPRRRVQHDLGGRNKFATAVR